MMPAAIWSSYYVDDRSSKGREIEAWTAVAGI